MKLAGKVTLDGDVERGIVWFFSRCGGGGAAGLQEEDVVRGLAGVFAAWKIRDALFRLQDQGVTMPVSRVQFGYLRRYWVIHPLSWSRIEPFQPSRTWSDQVRV